MNNDGSVIQSTGNNGVAHYPVAALAPWSPHSPNYTITAKIEATGFNNGVLPPGCGSNGSPGFGIAARVQQQSGYWAGIRFYDDNGNTCAKPQAEIAAVSSGSGTGATSGGVGPFASGSVASVFSTSSTSNSYPSVFSGKADTYQLKVQGIHFILSIDGTVVANGDDPSLGQAGLVGVWSDGVKIAVTDFKVTEQQSTPDTQNWGAWLIGKPKTFDWRRVDDVLGDDGSVIQSTGNNGVAQYPTALLWPSTPRSPNYTITAKIEATGFNNGVLPPGCGSNGSPGFGIAARVQQQSGYWAGIRFYDDNGNTCAKPQAEIAAVSSGSGTGNGPFASGSVASAFSGSPYPNVLDQTSHTYQLKVQGIHFALSIDGTVVASGHDPSLGQAGLVGVWSDGVKIAVLDFRVS